MSPSTLSEFLDIWASGVCFCISFGAPLNPGCREIAACEQFAKISALYWINHKPLENNLRLE